MRAEKTALTGAEAVEMKQTAEKGKDKAEGEQRGKDVKDGAEHCVGDREPIGFRLYGLGRKPLKDHGKIVVDGKKGFGNERVMPAGPLREPILKGLNRADGIVIAGKDEWGVSFYLQRNKIDLPVFTGHFKPKTKFISALKNKDVLAFAGIGRPQKFFDLLKKNNVNPIQTAEFPDHYFYTRFDIEQLQKKANGLPLVTTTKDAVKIPRDLLKDIHIADGEFVFDKPEEIRELLKNITL
jgi:tetraacyldisaccharide 4'-kinase